MPIISFIFKRYPHNTPTEYFWKDIQGINIVVPLGRELGVWGKGKANLSPSAFLLFEFLSRSMYSIF